MSGVMVSLAGEAVTRLPATVARVRICGAPTSQHAWASGSARFAAIRRGEDVVMRGQRADHDVVAVHVNIAQVRDGGEVDQRLGGAHATRQLDKHVGATGDEPRLSSVGVEQVQRLGQCR